jgi:hypothetical protein
MAPWCDHGAEGVPSRVREVGMVGLLAVPLAEAVRTGPLAALIVTVVLLLIVGAIFWSFLRRARKDGVSPLEVDRLEAPHLPEPADPAELPTQRPADPPDQQR